MRVLARPPVVPLVHAAVIALAVMLAHTAAATILIFDDLPTPVPADYGDNVTATIQGGYAYGVGAEGFTPNVEATYPQETRPYANNGGSLYGDLLKPVWTPLTELSIVLTADAGFAVQLFDFDLAAWDAYYASDPTINSVTVTDGSSTLFQALNATVAESGARTTFDFTGAPLTAAQLVITIDYANLPQALNGGPIAIDNVRFGQVPEPATAWLLGLGLTALAARRHSR